MSFIREDKNPSFKECSSKILQKVLFNSLLDFNLSNNAKY